MQITDIRQQIKRPDRYSIYVDGKFAFGLSEAALLQSALRIHQHLSSAELENLKDTARQDKAYNRALDLIARRPRSEGEMRDYLYRKQYDEPLIELTIQRLRRAGFLDDAAFAKMWVENRHLLKATSKRRLQQELRQKKVSDELIQNALEVDETDEKSVLKELIVKKRQQSRYQDDVKLMQYLVRQGFNYGDIKEILNEVE